MATRQTGSSPPADGLRRAEWAIALLATAVAILLSLTFFRHAGALWRDEVNSLNVAATPSLSAMWQRTEFDSFPLLWLLLLRGWLAAGLGSNDAGLRLLGLLGGLAVPAAVWFAALRFDRIVPLASLALLAVNPEVIRWSGSLRAWGLGTALAIVTLVLVREATAVPTRRRILLAGLVAVLSAQCVYQNAVLLAATVAGGVCVCVAEGLWRRAVVPVGIGMAAAVSLLPYIPTLRRVGAWSMLNQSPVTLSGLAGTAGVVVAASGAIVLACWSAVLCFALALGARRVLSPATAEGGARRDIALFALVSMGAAIGGLALVLLGLGYPTQPWYYLGLVALVAVCAETAIASSAPARTLRIAIASVALITLAAGLPRAWTALQQRQTNVDVVAAQLRAQAVRGDLIVANPWYLAISFERYYQGDVDVTTLPPLDDRSVHRYDLLKERMLSADPIGPLLSRIQQVLESGQRVWIVGGLTAPPPSSVPRNLPPPPLPRTGWSNSPYLQVWSLQTWARLRDHAMEVTFIPIEVPGGRFESPGLLVFRGWH